MDNQSPIFSDNVMRGPRPLKVCPICGPTALMYSGRIVSVVCQACKDEGLG